MTRPLHALLATSLSLFVACNAILGNEDNYTLVPPDSVGDAGAAGAPGAGAAGDSTSGGAGSGGVTQGGAAGSPSTSGGASGAGGASAGAGGSAGGEAGAAGAAGAAGGASCIPTGAEQCFNGVDDDCNGNVDCADAACADPAACVPAPAGATIGTFPAMGSDCPVGYAPLALRRGLSASPTCEGCSCAPDAGAERCESGIYGHGTYPCPSYQFSGLLYNSFSDRCQPFSGDQSVHFYAVRGFTTCTARGTAVPSAASFAETRSICAAERVGGGCATGSVCVPRVRTSRCTIQPGVATCGGAYPTSTGETWYTRMSDGRSCPACSCAFGSATCTGARIHLFSSTDCSGPAQELGTGAEGDVCAVPIVARSSRVSGTATNPSCQPNISPSGELTAADPRTVCCE